MIKTLYTHFFSKQFLLFLIVGFINTIFGYGIFAFSIFLGLHYAIASLLATVCGILFNFKTTGMLVFKSHDNRLIFRFIGVYSVVYILNVIGLHLFNRVEVNAYIAGALLLLPLAIIAFFLQKKFVFSKANQKQLS